MRRSLQQFIRLTVLLSVLGLLGIGPYQGYVLAAHPQVAPSAASSAESTDALIWQGKVLPIVTDVYASIGDLLTALQNRDTDGVAKVADQFAGEQARFEAIKPTPKAVVSPAKALGNSLRNMNFGTKALVVGLRASDNSGAQRGAQQIQQGLRQFQQAVNLIRQLSGPIAVATPAGPLPTPVIKGLP